MDGREGSKIILCSSPVSFDFAMLISKCFYDTLPAPPPLPPYPRSAGQSLLLLCGLAAGAQEEEEEEQVSTLLPPSPPRHF